jgi:NMD protein affecting ribosome stability and mRNA decay
MINLLKRLLGIPIPDGQCPTCGRPIVINARYPAALCLKCYSKAVDKNGQPLDFHGVVDHVCFVDGKQCWIDEAHFGGTVIQANTKRVPDFMTEEEYDAEQ